MSISELLPMKGAGGYFSPSHNVIYNPDDDSYLENDSGLEYRLFSSFEQFLEYHCDGKRDHGYLVSIFIGIRDEDGIISFNDGWDSNFVDPEEDGGSVYSFFMHSLTLKRVINIISAP